MATDSLRSTLFQAHLDLGARMVRFGGWDMPVQYPSGILAEVHAIRAASGIFDVSHMGRLYISGPKAVDLLDWVLTGSAATLRVGRARYCMICNERGGVIDDTIFYRLADDRFLIIPNAGNRNAVVAWFKRWNDEKFSGACELNDRTFDTALIAFQGPGTPSIMDRLCESSVSDLRPFAWTETRMLTASLLVGRTGYTGETGFEVLSQSSDANFVWNELQNAGAIPCGLGARDVLRLEAGLALHGHEIDEDTTPIEAGLERFVSFDKEYIGSDVLRQQRDGGVDRKLVGLRVAGRSAPRAGYGVFHQGQQIGNVTSGSYSPTLDTSIGMGYVLERYTAPDTTLELDIRGRMAQVEVTSLPFYTRPKSS